ncbi:MAG: hypothetical protein ACTSYA_09135 [Candidatus Kariarchaeaceae archaeon]
MSIYNIIPAVSTLIWLLIGIRQFKGTWGWFFMINGLSGLIAVSFIFIPGITPDRIYVSYMFLILFSLNYKFFDKYKYILIPTSLTLIIPALFLEHTTINSLLIASDIVVLLYFGRKFLLSLFNNNRLNLFFLGISFYAIIGIYKIAWLTIMQWEGVDLFELANIFHPIMMLPFLFILHDDERLSIELKRK